MAKHPSLSHVLEKQSKKGKKRHKNKGELARIDALKLDLLKIQEGIWQRKARAIIVFEGFDASGKGSCIRQITEDLDPRGVRVHPIGPPTEVEQGTHWLYRFWRGLPPPGQLAIFDRSWYGRVLVERVEQLCSKEAWKRAYREIREFEGMLAADGVDLIKIYLAVSPEEQLRRFRERLENPYKRWKLTMADVEARAQWGHYVRAADDLLRETHKHENPWKVIASDDKTRAQLDSLEAVVDRFSHHRDWLEAQKTTQQSTKETRKALKQLERTSKK